MNTLRVKIMALLIAATGLVIILATSITVMVLGAPHRELVDVAARQIAVLLPILEHASANDIERMNAPAKTVSPTPGQFDSRSTQLLTTALEAQAGGVKVSAYKQPNQFEALLSLEFPSGRVVWLSIIAIALPTSPWLVLASWLGLVLIGMIAIAAVAASWVTRPLALLQSTVANVDEHGVLPLMPEEGPAEIRATAAAINLLSKHLRHAMESRMRLVAAAGHDLRTPMTRMRLRAEFMADHDQRQPWLRDIQELDRIADSAIGLVREEVTVVNGERVDLRAVLSTMLEEMNDMGYSVEVTILEDAEIVAGPMALARALRNLLINAVTHGKDATVSLLKTGEACLVVIEDRGPGIPQELLGRVFEPFFRVNAARHQPVPGAGLGLAIAREIILRHGGRLSIENRAGGGLSQRITFPTAAP